MRCSAPEGRRTAAERTQSGGSQKGGDVTTYYYSNKKLLGAPGRTTRSNVRYERSKGSSNSRRTFSSFGGCRTFTLRKVPTDVQPPRFGESPPQRDLDRFAHRRWNDPTGAIRCPGSPAESLRSTRMVSNSYLERREVVSSSSGQRFLSNPRGDWRFWEAMEL